MFFTSKAIKIFLIINFLLISEAYATASLKKADYDLNFWIYEVQKNTNLSFLDRRVYLFENFAVMALQNQTMLYDNLKNQLKHLLSYLNELCRDECMQSSCQSGSLKQTYVKDWSFFSKMKWNEMPFIPKKETVYNVKNQIEWIQDRLKALSYAFCPMIDSSF